MDEEKNKQLFYDLIFFAILILMFVILFSVAMGAISGLK